MAKKATEPAPERGAKTKAVKDYFATHKKAGPKEVVAALKEQGIDVSPNMVSIIKAKSKVRKAKRQAKEAAADHTSSAVAKGAKAAGLDAALTLYKAAASSSNGGPSTGKIRQAFLNLVELLG